MRIRSVVIVCGLLALLVALGGVLFYDAARADRIAPGMTINGVDVGGMQVGPARVKLRRTVLEPLQKPMVVRHGDQRFELTAGQARLGLDVEGSVARALAVSREGSPFSRTWREVTREPLRRNVDARITYSRRAVKRLVERVGDDLDRKAVDAKVKIDASGVEVAPAREGRRIDAARLERQLRRRLVDYDGRRSVEVRTAVVEPNVSDSELDRRYPAVLIVDRSSFSLTLYKKLERAKRYDIAVGKVGMETPRGLYSIQNKAVNPDWYVPDSDWAGKLRGKVIKGDDPQNPIKARWMGIYDGAGIHGTDANDSIGSAASHGCIRMRIPEVIELYEQVPVDAPVYIA